MKGKNEFDVLMCYSGGKDSTYTLIELKEKYDLKIIAFTMDNGFLSKQAIRNIQTVAKNLDVKHITVKPPFDVLKKIFTTCSKKNIFSQKSIERASSICTSCMSIVKFSALRTALEMNIPFIAFGWSPGQAPITSSIMKNNPQMIKMMQKAVFSPLYNIAGEKIKRFFLEEKHFDGSYNFPYNISPLAFLEYNEEKLYEKIQKFGWKAPQDTDANSTNCLLNSYANTVHKKQFNFHPYAFEQAKLVREGYLDRETALEKINQICDKNTMIYVKKKLGIK
jgi:tRNA(Ile)-lysidine synthase TilS/MesJ